MSRRIARHTILASVLLLSWVPLWAPGASVDVEVYSQQALAADRQRYRQKFEFLLHKGLLDFMTGDERRALQGVVVRHPVRGQNLLSVQAVVFEGRPMVRAPVSSLKFIEDLSVAYAWRHRNRLSLEPIDEYLAMLKHRPEAFASGTPPEPLAALGVPPGIWERDPRVDDLSLRFRNSAWAFILAHELGHLRFGHTTEKASPAQAQRQEEQADAFAVDLLSRSDTIPMGMILWLQATAGYLKSRADFPSDAAWLDWVASSATHPVNGRRMQHLAALLRRQAASQRDADRAEVLQFIAVRLAGIGDIVEDPEMQRYLRRCATTRRVEDLRRHDDRPCL